MKALDLYCCDGGAAMGLHRAGFDEIVGIDINPHPNYPFEFIQGDALNPPVNLQGFDFIWASPKCQIHSKSTNQNKKGYSRRRGRYENQIPQTRELLKGSGKPFIIENVKLAPLRHDLVLSGAMFGLKVNRDRWFEIEGFVVDQPLALDRRNYPVYSICGDTSPKHERRRRVEQGLPQSATREEWQTVMGMPWSRSKANISEAVPPAYSEYIGREFFRTREFYK